MQFFRGGGKNMRRRKESPARRAAAILLSAILIAGMLSNAVPTNVLAKEAADVSADTETQKSDGGDVTVPAGQETATESGDESGTKPVEEPGDAPEIKPTNPAEGEGAPKPGEEPGAEPPVTGGQDGVSEPAPNDGTGQETPAPGGGTEQETPGTGTEEETEPGTVSGNDAAQEPVAAPQTVMMMAEPVEKHEHNDVTFTAWDKTDSLPTDAGDYYLTKDVTLSATWNVPGETTLCLNGKTIKQTTDSAGVVSVGSESTLKLYDCGDAGKITSEGSQRTVSSVSVGEGGTFYMYGGNISGNISRCPAVYVNKGEFRMSGGKIAGNRNNSTDVSEDRVFGGGVNICCGTFWMEGGEISDNHKYNSVNNGMGGGVCLLKESVFRMSGGKIAGNTGGIYVHRSEIHMSGGEVTGNTAGGGISLFGVATMTACGNIVITGNTDENEKEKNLFISIGTFTIDPDSSLSGSENIGVTTGTTPTEGNPVNITGANSADYSSCFYSDNPDYEIVNGENNVVQLAVKSQSHTHEADEVWQQDADGHWHSCKNGCGEKLDYAVHTFEGNECNVCGYSKTPTETHEHNDVTFTPWTATDSLPDVAGNYYLTENVTLSATWDVPGEETTLCLNGKTISTEGNANDSKWLIVIGDREDFENGRTWKWNLFDCAGGGQITGGQYGCVGNGTTFYMYGGKITGGIRYGVDNSGAFYMYGGEISGNGNGGTYCDQHGSTITVGGSAVIAGNNSKNVWIGVDSLIEIDEENPLSGSAKIGITTQTAPTAGNPVNITGENGKDYSKFFHSDNPDYVIVNGENNVVQLAVKPYTHNLTRVDAKAATCTEDGNTAYYTCDGCDQWFSDESGTQEITDKTSVVIPAAGHAFDDIEWGYKVADGHAHNCKNCDAHDEIQEHTPGDAATESTPQTCTECGYIIKPAIGHTCDPRLVEKKEPDCTTAGKEAYYHCEGCGKNYEDEAGTRLIADISAWGSIAAPGHDWGEWTVTKPATATTLGEKERTCKRCDEKETETIPKKGGGNKPGGGSGSGGNSGGGSDDNSGGNSGDDGGDNGGNGSGSSGGNDSAGGSTGNTGGTGAGTSGKPGVPGTGQPRVKQEKEGNIRKEVRVEGEDTLDATVETPLSELADIVLTKEEKQRAAAGTDVKIVLDVKDASAVVSAADKALVEKALNGPQAKGYTLGQYLDISLYKVIGDSRNIVTETNGKITVTIDVPDSLKNTDSTKTRTFAVIRIHNGKAELLTDLDDNADTITIKTDRFSTYAVVYKDTAGGNGDGGQSESGKPGVIRVSTKSDGKNPGGGKDNEPKTGDRTPLELGATLSMIAGLTYLLLYFADRRHGMTEETKRELVSRLIAWAKQGGKGRTCLALAAIFVLLVYYHSIGKKSCAEWREVYGE